MSAESSLHRLLTSIAAVAALALIAAPSIALGKDKPGYEEAYYDEEIIITAPGVYRDETGRTASGARIETLTTQRVVYTGDLDLRYSADVDELHRRIQVTAREACNELERHSDGIMLDSQRECVRDATRDAMAEAQAMVVIKRG